jgi:DNA polymerase-4/protein ImuB
LRAPDIESRPVVIDRGAGSRKLVLDYSPGLSGLQPGMPLQGALARHNKAGLIQADIPYYWSVFNRILDGLETTSPLVEGIELGQAYLGIDGLQFIYPDDERLVAAVTEVLPGIFIPQMGIAGGKFPAYLAALYCSPGGYKALYGDISSFLGGLPCDILPVSIRSKGRLRDFGINTLGQLAALPEGPLQSQFGPEGKRMQALACGSDDTPLYPRLGEETIEASTILTSVTVSLETMLVAVEELLAPVFVRIGIKGLGISRLSLWARTWNWEHWERNVQFKEPVADVPAAISRIKRVMENFPPPGPVEELGMRVTRLGYPRGRQNSLFREVRGRDNLLEDIHQLELRQGNPQVFKIKEVEPWSRIPERRYTLTPTGR